VGAWGPGIFSNDLAADVRGDWREAVLAGEDPEAATDRILGPFGAAAPGAGQDPDAAIAWTALAAAQSETGRLLDRVRDRALAFIEAGGDLELWEEGAAARRRALDRLAVKLRGPQPAPKRLRRTRSHAVEFALGDVIRVQGEGVEALAVVIGESPGGRGPRNPRVELLAWRGGEVPDDETLASLPAVPDVGRPDLRHIYEILTPRKADAFGPHIGEVVARGVARPKIREKETLHSYTHWPGLVTVIGWPAHQEGIRLALERPPKRLAGLRARLRRS
jgi:hypothetical protein